MSHRFVMIALSLILCSQSYAINFGEIKNNILSLFNGNEKISNQENTIAHQYFNDAGFNSISEVGERFQYPNMVQEVWDRNLQVDQNRIGQLHIILADGLRSVALERHCIVDSFGENDIRILPYPNNDGKYLVMMTMNPTDRFKIIMDEFPYLINNQGKFSHTDGENYIAIGDEEYLDKEIAPVTIVGYGCQFN